MAEYGALVEYLLGYERPGGGKLVRFGATVNRIPTFPPNFTITITTFPRFNSFMSIQYLGAISPHMVPSAFWMTSFQVGIAFQGAFLSGLMQGIHNSWVEVTQSNPIVTTVTNMTPLMQYYEFGNSYLLVATEEDYLILRQVIDNWYSNSRLVIEAIEGRG